MPALTHRGGWPREEASKRLGSEELHERNEDHVFSIIAKSRHHSATQKTSVHLYSILSSPTSGKSNKSPGHATPVASDAPTKSRTAARPGSTGRPTSACRAALHAALPRATEAASKLARPGVDARWRSVPGHQLSSPGAVDRRPSAPGRRPPSRPSRSQPAVGGGDLPRVAGGDGDEAVGDGDAGFEEVDGAPLLLVRARPGGGAGAATRARRTSRRARPAP